MVTAQNQDGQVSCPYCESISNYLLLMLAQNKNNKTHHPIDKLTAKRWTAKAFSTSSVTKVVR
ncbi:MAG TPA: hypothetical protein VKA95_11815 [Nitrososphaeraceae archaeon]|nr:hypothetical protein [Nitrososphaeraceae archaeon]